MKVSKTQKKQIAWVLAIGMVVMFIINSVFNARLEKFKIRTSDPELLRTLTYGEFEEGSDGVDGTDNVKFSAFFLRDLDSDGYAESVKGTCKELGKQDTLYMELNVLTEGKLTNGKIEINGQNFYLQTALPKDEELKENYIGNNTKTIELNDIQNGTQKMITGVIRSYTTSSYNPSQVIGNNTNNYSRDDNTIILTGTYVAQDGTETDIRKEIPLTVDWYGTTKATINSTNQTRNDLQSRIDEENGLLNLSFTVNTEELDKTLILKDNHVEGTIPELNGYAPVSVTCSNGNVEFEYDEETKKFIIDRTSTVGTDGIVQNSLARQNSYAINVQYPLDAFTSMDSETVQIKIPVSTYYEGYNNPNSEFRNPYKSNIPTATITATYSYYTPTNYAASIGLTVGDYLRYPDSSSYRYVVSKRKPLRIYNGVSSEEKDDTYKVRWSVYTGTNGEYEKLVLKEDVNQNVQNVDNFITKDATKDSMENITTNIGIGFSGAENLLKDGGEIKVYDDTTGNLLVTISKDDVTKYTESSPYKFDTPVKHIRVETTETNKDKRMYVYSIKELDDTYITENYTFEEFENLDKIESYLKVYGGESIIGSTSNTAKYEAPFS